MSSKFKFKFFLHEMSKVKIFEIHATLRLPLKPASVSGKPCVSQLGSTDDIAKDGGHDIFTKMHCAP